MDKLMRIAIEEAQKGKTEGGIPSGSVLVKNRDILGKGHNRRIQDNNPIMHAEINCLNNVGRMRSYRGTISILHSCYATSVQAQLSSLVSKR
jgi:creatinine deaminase